MFFKYIVPEYNLLIVFESLYGVSTANDFADF